MSRAPFLVMVALAVLFEGRGADAALKTPACLVLKRQAWSALRKCEAAEQVKAIKGKPSDLAKCRAKFQDKQTKIDAKAAKAGIACRYGDNGDDTVTDYDTGLQWEEKHGPVGGDCTGDVHCVNDSFGWIAALAFVDVSSDAATITANCFSGFCDWRLPKIDELRSLVTQINCPTSPCIDPAFGPTIAAGYYWSSTDSNAIFPNSAWAIAFGNGSFAALDKGGAVHVRVVRHAL